jgi:replicative DNA helicase
MNSASPQSVIQKVNAQSINLWNQSVYEHLYLGWCFANLDSSSLLEALSFVDETWFFDSNRRILFTSLFEVFLESSRQAGCKITRDKISIAAQKLSGENSQWADRCIDDCLAVERQTIFNLDTLYSGCILRWQIVKAKPLVQNLIADADRLLSDPAESKETPARIAEILTSAAESWSDSVNGIKRSGEITELDFVEEILTPIDPSIPLFAPSSVKAFDDQLLGGVAINNNTVSGRLILVSGRPGMGKTATAVSVAKGMASNGHKIVYCTLEVPRRQIFQRLLCIHDFSYQLETRGSLVDCIKTTQVAKRTFTYSQEQRIREYRGSLSTGIFIYDNLSSVEQIIANLKMLKKRHPEIVTIFIDHLGLLDVKHENKAIGIGEITAKLKRIAVELTMDIILLHQLNRESEKRNNKRPILSDLRDSGAIEQDADQVIGLYRDIEQNPQELEIISLKNRHGPLGTTKCNFYLEYGTVR